MRVLILGSHGYLGIALRQYLEGRGHKTFGVDNGMRDRNVKLIGSDSLTPVQDEFGAIDIDITNYRALEAYIAEVMPDAIVHFAEQPSAPFSMRSAKDATDTQRNNVIGTLNLLWAVKAINPQIHVVKLGTAGEYPDWLYEGITVPEGSRIKVNYQEKEWEIPTPRYAGSWYHFSKLHDSMNIDYACRIWGLRATDLNQGIVYGHVPNTRFDYDYFFGTVVNRFVAQAIAGIPLTVYGNGGQMRGFISIKNVLEAISIVLEHPAKQGEFRVWHQLTETHTVLGIASWIAEFTGAKIDLLKNPRAEKESNILTFEANALKKFGLRPLKLFDELPDLISRLAPFRSNVRQEVIQPKATWK